MDIFTAAPALIACNGGFGCTRIATHKQSRDGHVSFKCWEHAYPHATSDYNVVRSDGFPASGELSVTNIDKTVR